ncbi:hypothetical protein K1719_008958 [Acacia pycnantha]|nr:hypothetical protein K1719_008958 [Acacia pycnantha]
MLGFKEEEQSKFDLMDTNLTPRLETVHLKPSQRKENEDDKDVKIRELTAELLRERKRRAVLQQQLEIILRGVEEHSNKVSKTINDTLQRVREVEEKGKGNNNSTSSKIEAAE